MEEPQPFTEIDSKKHLKTITVRQLLMKITAVMGLVAVVFGLLYIRELNLGSDSIIDVKKPPHYLFSVYGSEKQYLRYPMSVFVSRDGDIYVADTNNHKIQVFSFNGNYRFSFGKPGVKPGELANPYGITENEKGNLLIAETGNKRIQEFTPAGKFIRIVTSPAGPIKVEKPGPLYSKKGKLYIGDLVKHEIIVVDEGGKVERIIGNVRYPHGVAADKKGNIYISESGGYRIAIFDNNGRQKKSISGFSGEGGFSSLRGLALDSGGRIYVADSIASRILVFNPEGEYLFSFGTKGYDKEQFLFPVGIFIDKSNRIFVADWANNRVEVWGY